MVLHAELALLVGGRSALANNGSQGEDGTEKHGLTRRQPPSELEWLTVLRQFRDLVQQICETPLVRGDHTAQRIIHDMLHAPNPEFVDTQLARLAERVAELLAVKAGSAAQANLASVKSAGQGRASLMTAFNPHAGLAEESARRPARTFLKL